MRVGIVDGRERLPGAALLCYLQVVYPLDEIRLPEALLASRAFAFIGIV